MVASSNFLANDYHLAFNLQKAFYEYVELYTQLHYPENLESISTKERQEMNLKVQEAINKISLVALEMKQCNSETKILKNATPSLINTTAQSNRMPC